MNQLKLKNPEITWEKQTCPFCGLNTGTETNCEKLSKSNKLVVTKAGISLPVFTKNCKFKKINAWIAHLNFKITPSLLEKLSAVEGIESIECGTQYSFTIVIAKLYDENVVKSSTAMAYRSYIKDMMSISIRKEDLRSGNNIVGIVMPNGKSFENLNSSSEFSELLARFSRFGKQPKPIFRKD